MQLHKHTRVHLLSLHVSRLGRLKDQKLIPPGEIWLKIGGDKGGKTMKLNFQILNTLHPNSPTNTCVFAAFEASDTRSNTLIALERYQAQIQELKGLKWRLEVTLQIQLLTSTSIEILLEKSSPSSCFFRGTMSSYVPYMGFQELLVMYYPLKF